MSHFTFAQLAIGQPLLTVQHTVSIEMIRSYAAATGDTHPWHTAGGAPFGEPVAPPAIVTIFSTAVLGQPGLDRPPGDIHARHEYECLAPIRAGRVVRTSSTVADKYEKRGRKFVVFVTSSVDDAGVEVARCRVTIAVPE